eukprot:296395_1
MESTTTPPAPSNLADLPTDMLSHISTFLEMWQLLDISKICKRMHQVSLLPSSFNGEFLIPKTWPKCITNRTNINILHRFCNCRIVHFQYKNSLRASYLNFIINSWSIEKRSNVESLQIEHTFDNTHLDSLKSCFPNIKIIHLNANGKNFRNNTTNAYYINCVIPLINLYATTLTKLHLKFDIACDTVMIPNKFVECLENIPNLQTFAIAGISMDLRNKHIDTNRKLFRIPMDANNNITNEIFDTFEIPMCGICLPLNLNHNYVTKLKLNWDVCSNCMLSDCANIHFIHSSLSNLETLSLRLRLNGANTSLILLNKWIHNTLCFNNIYELKIELGLTRDLWTDNTEIVTKSISELVQKIVNNNSNNNYKRITFKVCETDCGNASYLHLLKNILCKWIKVLTNELKTIDRRQSNVTYVVEIIIDHQLPELIFIDEYHYKPIALKAINDIFENIMSIDAEISFRFILQTTSPWTPSSIVSNGKKYEEFYDSLKRLNVNTSYHKKYHRNNSCTWIIFNYISKLIVSNNKQQLLFNATSSAIFDELCTVSDC